MTDPNPPSPPAPSHRRRKRAAWHRQADGAQGEQPPPVLEHPRVPQGDPTLVEDAAGVAALVERLRNASLVGFDTEFIGEETYRPRVCLVQVVTDREVVLVDPLRLAERGESDSLQDLYEAIASPHAITLVHAGFHDVEAIRLAIGREPERVVDTQVAAAMGGLAWPASLATVLEALAGHRPGKAHTFTEWDARPLSRTQLLYAADDVRYLPLLWDRLAETLEAKGRLDWALEESAERLADAPFDPRSQVKRIARADLVGLVNRSIIAELVLERQAIARDHDVPPRGALPDAAVADIARARPADADALRRVKGIPGRTREQCADRLVAAVARGLANPVEPDAIADAMGRRAIREEVDRAWPQLQARCGELGLATELVLSRAEFTGWFCREVAHRFGRPMKGDLVETRESPFPQGSWREAALGETVRALRDGIELPAEPESKPKRRRRGRRERSEGDGERGEAPST